jgi:hypothetical protein
MQATTITSIYDQVLVDSAIRALDGERVNIIDLLDTYITRLENAHIDSRLFTAWGCDCTERALFLHYECIYPQDSRPRDAIDAIRLWLKGEASSERVAMCGTEAGIAARYVLDPATKRAAYSAYRLAAMTADHTAAWAVTKASAREAAHAARLASIGGWDSEIRWQLERLRQIVEGGACNPNGQSE